MPAPRFFRFFEVQEAGASRWLAMEGLRGIAVILVFFVHYSTEMTPYFGGEAARPFWISILHEVGNTGVDLFFVLSGFLIYRAVIRRRPDYLKYAFRRVERIYPAFLFVLAIYLALSFLVPSTSKLPADGGAALTYVLANILVLPGIFDIDPIVTVAWSLSYEALYYIVIPSLTGLLLMRSWSPGQRLAFFVALYLGYVVAQYFGYGFRFRLSLFIGGIMLYEIACLTGAAEGGPERPWTDRLAVLMLPLSLVCFTLLGGSHYVLAGTVFEIVPGFFKYLILCGSIAFLVYRCIYASGPASRLFSWHPLRWLGNMSYSYYLMHSLGLHFFFKILGLFAAPDIGSIALYVLCFPFAFAASVMAAVPVFLFIERPLSLRLPTVSIPLLRSLRARRT